MRVGLLYLGCLGMDDFIRELDEQFHLRRVFGRGRSRLLNRFKGSVKPFDPLSSVLEVPAPVFKARKLYCFISYRQLLVWRDGPLTVLVSPSGTFNLDVRAALKLFRAKPLPGDSFVLRGLDVEIFLEVI